MLTALMFILIGIGIFEIWVFHQSHQEEDLYVIAMLFFAAGFMFIMRVSGGWI